MGLNFLQKSALNSSLTLVSKANKECGEFYEMILPIRDEIGENWQGDAATAMQDALSGIYNEVKEVCVDLSEAESSINYQRYYIINNYTGDED